MLWRLACHALKIELLMRGGVTICKEMAAGCSIACQRYIAISLVWCADGKFRISEVLLR